MEKTILLNAIQDGLKRILTDPESLDIKDEIQAGIEVEREHKDIYDMLKGKFGDQFDIPEDDFYKMIADAHLKENPDYYKILLMIGL